MPYWHLSAVSFTTFFFPVGDDIRQIVADWVTHLRSEKLWGNDDPLFPRTQVTVGADGQFAPSGLEREHWCNATPIRKVFREAFEAAELPYFNPHSLRRTLVELGETICQTPEAFKAWSQNLGHEGVLTTFRSYGQVATSRQGDIIRGMAMPRRSLDVPVEAPTDLQGLLRNLVEAEVRRQSLYGQDACGTMGVVQSP